MSGVRTTGGDLISAVDVILGGYAHAPRLRLTCDQACQVWGLDLARCQGLFDALVDAGFLCRGTDGAYGLVH